MFFIPSHTPLAVIDAQFRPIHFERSSRHQCLYMPSGFRQSRWHLYDTQNEPWP